MALVCSVVFLHVIFISVVIVHCYIITVMSTVEVLLCQTMNFNPPQVPYWFQTPKGSDIDLRLFNRGQCLCAKVVTSF